MGRPRRRPRRLRVDAYRQLLAPGHPSGIEVTVTVKWPPGASAFDVRSVIQWAAADAQERHVRVC